MRRIFRNYTVNPIALRMAKTLLKYSFGPSECNSAVNPIAFRMAKTIKNRVLAHLSAIVLLTLLHSEWPKLLKRVLAHLSAIVLRVNI